MKKNLRNYKLDKKTNSEDHNISILIHKVDGRLLLTGKSGIYEDYIRTKFGHYEGRFMLLLLDEFDDDLTEPGEKTKPMVKDLKVYTIESESYVKTEEMIDNIYDQEKIKLLSDPDKGNQPIVSTLAKTFRLIYIKGVVNYYQLQMITQNFKNSLHLSAWDEEFEEHGFGNLIFHP